MMLTQPDHDQIVRMLKAGRATATSGTARSRLSEALGAATVVDPTTIPPTVVTMNSVVTVIEMETGEITSYALVYPADANVDRLRISVLAPLGAALLGRSEGEIVEVDGPAGTKRYFVQKVAFQPESRLGAGAQQTTAA